MASNSQHVCNETSAFKKAPKPCSKGKGKQIKGTNLCPSENILNIQPLYDVNQAIVSDIWDGNFHSISLHRLVEHLVLDAINIRESLHHIMKYILNKKVERGKANDVNNFKDISEAA